MSRTSATTPTSAITWTPRRGTTGEAVLAEHFRTRASRASTAISDIAGWTASSLAESQRTTLRSRAEPATQRYVVSLPGIFVDQSFQRERQLHHQHHGAAANHVQPAAAALGDQLRRSVQQEGWTFFHGPRRAPRSVLRPHPDPGELSNTERYESDDRARQLAGLDP